MANIHAIREYDFYGMEFVDILYSKDGYITRVYTMPKEEMPKTARKWMEGKVGETQKSWFHDDRIVKLYK